MNGVATQPYPLMAGRTRAENPDKTRNLWATYGPIAFCLVHIPLAVLVNRIHALSAIHAVAVFAVGMWWALTAPHQPLRVAYVAAYITGAEVLWRMTHAPVFWEFGKYSIVAIFLVAILRSGRMKGPGLMLAYFALLLPSIWVLVMRTGISSGRGYISFNLSGPLAMMVAAWFFSRQKLSVEQVKRIFLAGAAPIIGIGAITLFAISSATNVNFGTGSNLVSSGGFGPNQVSAALGLGALFALMFVLLGNTNNMLKFVMLGAMSFMAVQSALTFSRGGMYNTAGAVAFASIYLLRDPRTRRTLLVVAVLVFVFGSYVILPRLEDLTGGTLTTRFSSTNSTNRIEIISDDLYLFQAFPILGVGPGGSKKYGTSTAHTEFARLLAEHGTLGLVALLLLLLAAASSIRQARTIKGKAIAVCLIGWSFLYMLNAAMRLAAPAFVFGLAFATVLPERMLSPKAMLTLLRLKLQQRAVFQRPLAAGQILRTKLQ
jgi:hypothetical protein